MISSVRGNVLAAAGTVAVIEVGGVGLSIHVTPQHALGLTVGHEASLATALIVREDDLSLYGFRETEELTVFDLLRGVTGVGPRSAMGILSAMTPQQVAHAVSLEDDGAFRTVSGIGPKTAKLIILTLTGKLIVPAAARTTAAPKRSSVAENVTVALIGLGWPERVAMQAVEDATSTEVGAGDGTDLDSVPGLLRRALANLGPRGGHPGQQGAGPR